jgi:hypothetical protein
VIDHDYVYAGEVLDLSWSVTEEHGRKGNWPKWTKTVKDYEIVLEPKWQLESQ